MAVAAAEWLALIEREYIQDLIAQGGATTRFIVADTGGAVSIEEGLAELSARHRLVHVGIDAARTKLHLIQEIFFAIARSIDWDELARSFLEALFRRRGYRWSDTGAAATVQELADLNGIDITLLRRDLRSWLSTEIMHDPEMTQDFRIAVATLCLHQVDAAGEQVVMPDLAKQWLRGEIGGVGALRQADISTKINRHTGRGALRSLCRWLRRCGRPGLCLVIDIRQLGRVGAQSIGGIRYTPAAVMDAFEILRQFIDDAEQLAGLLTIVQADDAFIDGDARRSVDAYLALKMRIWDDVRAEGRDNPLAPLVRLPLSVPREATPLPC